MAKQGRDLKGLSASLFALFLLPLWVLGIPGRPRDARLRPFAPAAVWLAVSTAAAFTAPFSAMPELLRQALFLSLLAAGQILLVRADLRRLFSFWILLLLPVCAYALVQRLGYDPVAEFRAFGPQSRVFSTFGNPDFLGAHLAFLLPILAACAFEPARYFLRAGAATLGLFALLVLVWTGSRGAWLGAGTGLAAWLLLTFSRPKPLRSPLFFAGAGLFVAVLFALNSASILESLSRHTDRPLLWRGSLLMLRQRPLLGWGLGSFSSEYPAFAPDAFSLRMRADNTFAEHAHCEYLNAAVETGVAGLGVFLWLLASVLRGALLAARSGGLWSAAPAALLAALVHAAFDRNFRLASTAIPFWLLSGMAFSRRDTKNIPSFPAPSRVRRFGLPLLIALSLLLSSRVLRPLQASYRVSSEPDFLAPRPFITADDLDRKRVSHADDPSFYMELGNARAREGDFRKAIEAFGEASRLAPGWDAPANNIGNSFFMLSLFDEAISAYRRALELNPDNNDARFNLAFAYFHQRKIKEARRECDKLLEADPYNYKALQLRDQLRP